jgi:hypothetical protein
VLRFERLFLADEQSLIPRSLAFANRGYKHGGSSASPPSASLYRERIIYNDWSNLVRTKQNPDRPVLAQSCRLRAFLLLGRKDMLRWGQMSQV